VVARRSPTPSRGARTAMSDAPRPVEPASRTGLAQVVLAGVLWGTGGLVVSVLHTRSGMGALTVSSYRLTLAALALLTVAVATGRLHEVGGLLRGRSAAVVAVGVGTACYQALYFLAVLRAGVAVSTVVSLGLAPLLVTAWESWRRRRGPGAMRMGVVVAALAGLALVSTGTPHLSTDAHHAGVGILLAALSGIVYAITTVVGHHLMRPDDVTGPTGVGSTGGPGPLTLTTATTTVGAVVLAPFGFLVDGVHRIDVATVGLLGYLGIGTMALAYSLLYAGLRTTSGGTATLATLVEPLTAAALAALLLDERLSASGIGGGCLILGSVAALSLTGRVRPTPL
jgi:DME family drug/metabolite transporter